MKVYPNGLGESQGGDPLLGQAPFWVGGNVWWVNSATGSDAGGTAGQDRERPLATLSQAVTNSASGDVIVLQYGHTETLTGAANIGIRTVVGVGTISGKPSVQLKINAASASLITMGGSGGQLRNIYFPAAVQSNNGATGKVSIPAATNCLIYGCYFEASGNDQFDQVQAIVASNNLRIENCTFVSTATAIAARPTNGVRTTGAITDVAIVGCVFDDGTVGFSGKALDLSGGTITRLAGHGNSLLRGADVVNASATTGYFGTGTLTGGSAVSW